MADKLYAAGMSARNTALRILTEVNDQGSYANISLKKNLNNSKYNDMDISFITQLVYGTLDKQITIDHIINKFSNSKRIRPVVMNILRLGCYQILYMDRVPDSAACNESVNLCKKCGLSGLGGFVNGILRNISRHKYNILNFDYIESYAERLSLKYSYPLDLVNKWVQDYGTVSAEDILRNHDDEGYTSVRVNRLKTTVDRLISDFAQAGIEAKPGSFLPEALLIKGYGNISESKQYKEGLITVQGEASMLVTHILDPKEGNRILDACASPGAKATHIAEYINMNGCLYAWDIHPHRVELINNNIRRTGSNIITTGVRDASVCDSRLKDTFDRVLVDVPCSGWGIIGKKPDIKLRANINLSDLLKTQFKILNACSSYVVPGGYMVYSTCTINKDENERMVYEFLKQNKNFDLDDFEYALPKELRGSYQLGMIQLIPYINRTDGFFIAKMKRKN